MIGGESQPAVDMNAEVKGLIETLKMHIEEAKSKSDKITKEIDDKIRQVQLLNVEMEKLYRKADEKSKDRGSQKYVEAIKLAKEGKEAEEICEELGLLRGEVDLIVALNKVDSS